MRARMSSSFPLRFDDPLVVVADAGLKGGLDLGDELDLFLELALLCLSVEGEVGELGFEVLEGAALVEDALPGPAVLYVSLSSELRL